MPIGHTAEPTGLFDRTWRFLTRLGSRLPNARDRVPPPSELEKFKQAQRTAYECVMNVATQLREGITERETAELLKQHLHGRGITRYLHTPFAWFGEHAAFDGYTNYADYHASDRALRAGEAVVLDVSPMVDGYIGDVGYATSLGFNAELTRAKKFLQQLRATIPLLFMSERGTGEIWSEVDRLVRDAGFINVHARYPLSVLGHRVFRVTPREGEPLRIFRSTYLGWFSLEANLGFLRGGVLNQTLGPEHRGAKLGLWAIEPHIGWPGGGAKFEELLVVEPHRAWWLDDDVPHASITST